ncbi:hypothetical protein CSUI_007909, partial [Cystoisospora suis]
VLTFLLSLVLFFFSFFFFSRFFVRLSSTSCLLTYIHPD